MILLFTDYFNSLENDEEDFDWMHINSLSLIGDDSLILSSRETSSIIKISDIYGSPTVDYLISSDQFWEPDMKIFFLSRLETLRSRQDSTA